MQTDDKQSGVEGQASVVGSERRTVTPLQRAGRIGLDLINPFSDLVVIYRKGVLPSVDRFKLLHKILTHQPAAQESLNWEQAVQRAGKPIEHLQKTFKAIRAAWWVLMAVTGGLAALLLLMMMITKLDLPSATLLRAGMALVVLACLSGVGFVKALIASYRLWQLQMRRVSEEEGGTFQHFLSETRWCRQVITLGMAG